MGITGTKFARLVAASAGHGPHPYQIKMMRDLDEYYARAKAVGVSTDDATQRISRLMGKAQCSRRYSSADAFRDAKRSLLPKP